MDAKINQMLQAMQDLIRMPHTARLNMRRLPQTPLQIPLKHLILPFSGTPEIVNPDAPDEFATVGSEMVYRDIYTWVERLPAIPARQRCYIVDRRAHRRRSEKASRFRALLMVFAAFQAPNISSSQPACQPILLLLWSGIMLELQKSIRHSISLLT